MTDKLKPCPICAGDRSRAGHDLRGYLPLWFTFCQDCGVRGPQKRTRDEAIDAWNRRSAPPGYVLVPEEPTDAMQMAGWKEAEASRESGDSSSGMVDKVYRAMINAAKGETDG